jgi:LAGLIDADG DNA endonuclease family
MSKKPTKEQLLQDVLSDLTWQQIAEKYGYTDSRFLRKLAKRWDLPPRRKILKPTKEQLEDMIIRKGMTPYEVAKELGYSEGGWSNIYAYCRQYGIEFDFTPHADLRNTPFTDEQKSIVYGTLLGDGYLKPSNNRENPSYSLVIAHGAKQKEYLEWKKEKLSNFIIKEDAYIKQSKTKYNHSPTYRYDTIAHPFLTELRRKFYPNGVKTVSKEWLNHIDELALAVWFMDDGSLNKRYGTMLISTNNFSYEEHVLIQQWFLNRWDIPVKIESRKSSWTGKTQYSIRINSSVAKRFREIISPYVPDCMKYKITLGG